MTHSAKPVHDPCHIVSQLLQNTSDPPKLSSLCTPDCTFVSITYNNPPLTKILPFAGRHVAEGPQAILDTFATVDAIWFRDEFTIDSLFAGQNNVGEAAIFGHSGFAETDPTKEAHSDNIADVGVFGSFTLRSRTTGRVLRSPYCVWAKVDTDEGKVVYMQYLEDTLGTTSILKVTEGYGKFHVFPDKEQFDV